MRHNKLSKKICLLIIPLIILSICIQVRAITWSSNNRQLTTNTFYDGYPALTQTNDLRIWHVWSREADSNLTLYYKISSDLGRTWSQEENLTDITIQGQDQNPSIMQAANSTIWVVWTSDRPLPPPPPTPDFHLDASPQNITIPRGESENSTIIVTSLNDFSDAVSLTLLNPPTGVTALLDPNQVVPPPNLTANSNLTLTVDLTATPGNYTLTVLGNGDHTMHTVNVYLEIPVAGEAGQTSTGISSSSSIMPSAGIQDYEIYYKTSHDNGATWSKDIQLTNNSLDDLRPAIIQLSNGTIMIVWQSYITDSHDICYATTNDGITWSSPTQLTTDPAHDKGPAAMRTKDGKIWVAWTSVRTGDYEIFYKIHDGVSWGSDTQLTTSTNSDVQPAIVQAIDGEMLIFWATATTSSSYDIYYKKSSDNGYSWSSRIALVASNYEEMWPAVMRAKDTKIWVAWQSNEGDIDWNIYCKTSLAGDVNQDNSVNVIDLTLVSLAYGSFEGEPDYNPSADINKDGIVDMRDLRIVAYYLGET